MCIGCANPPANMRLAFQKGIGFCSVCVCGLVCVCVCACMCVCACVCVDMCVYVCTYVTADVVLSILKNGMNERFAGSAAGTAFGDVCASLILIPFPLIFLVLIIFLQLLPLMLLVELGHLRCLLIKILFSLRTCSYILGG